MANRRNEDVELLTTFLQSGANNKQSKGSEDNSPKFGRLFRRATTINSTPQFLDVNKDDGFDNLGDVLGIPATSSIEERNGNSFQSLSINRYRQYQAYDQMAEDVIISSALDMYSEDSTQTNDNGERLTISNKYSPIENNGDSKSNTQAATKAGGDVVKNNSKIVRNIINALDIEKKLPFISRMLAHYGDVYLELTYTKPEYEGLRESVDSSHTLQEYTNDILEIDKLTETHETKIYTEGYALSDIHIIPDIENMFDLQVNGKTVAFAHAGEDSIRYKEINGQSFLAPSSITNTSIKYYPPDKFVHLYIQPNIRNIELYTVSINEGDKSQDVTFEICRGKSMLHDVFRIERDLQLLEYSVMLSRASRSSIFRFVKVHVGNMQKNRVDSVLRMTKNLIEGKITLNQQDGTFSPYLDPGPIENFIYVPVNDAGQGDLSIDTVGGGDVNVRDIADIEYLQNKLFAGLKIPKSYLNYSDAGVTLFNSGGALTKQDARYARTIKGLQVPIAEGINRCIELILISRGLGHIVNTFDVKLIPPATTEDSERLELIQGKVSLASDFINLATSVVESSMDKSEIDMTEFLKYLSNNVLDDSSFAKIFKEKIPEIEDLEHEDEMNIGRGELPDMGSIMPNPTKIDNTGGGVPHEPTRGTEIEREESHVEEPIETEPIREPQIYGGEWANLR